MHWTFFLFPFELCTGQNVLSENRREAMNQESIQELELYFMCNNCPFARVKDEDMSSELLKETLESIFHPLSLKKIEKEGRLNLDSKNQCIKFYFLVCETERGEGKDTQKGVKCSLNSESHIYISFKRIL